jgi:hypothetical protein
MDRLIARRCFYSLFLFTRIAQARCDSEILNRLGNDYIAASSLIAPSRTTRNFRIPGYGGSMCSDRLEAVGKEWPSNKAARG